MSNVSSDSGSDHTFGFDVFFNRASFTAVTTRDPPPRSPAGQDSDNEDDAVEELLEVEYRDVDKVEIFKLENSLSSHPISSTF